MKAKLSFTIALLLLLSSVVCAIPSCAPRAEDATNEDPLLLAAGSESYEDMSDAYIDSFIFFGESTTYHLKSRGVLSGGTETLQVWAPLSGTVNLNEDIHRLLIVYPETGEEISLAEALQRKQPQRILFCFGLNGAESKLRRGKEYFKSCYRILLDLVRTHSPDTEILLQSAFPVASNMDMSRYSVDIDTLNCHIETINSWSAELAAEYGIGYRNTAEVLKDELGRLRPDYQCGDGYHLTSEAYRTMLRYLSERAKEEDA